MLERLKGYKFSPKMTVHCHNVNCCTVHSEYRLSSPRNKMVWKIEPLGYHIQSRFYRLDGVPIILQIVSKQRKKQ